MTIFIKTFKHNLFVTKQWIFGYIINCFRDFKNNYIDTGMLLTRQNFKTRALVNYLVA